MNRSTRAALSESLRAGHRVLRDGGSGLDAVIAAIVVMEDSPLFNAGKGAVFNHERAGTSWTPPSWTGGRSRRAPSRDSTHVKNPIELARKVMEKSPHVMMVGGRLEEAFAKAQGLNSWCPHEYFRTEERWEQLQKALEKEKKTSQAQVTGEEKFGTVGAVALNQAGNLAAGTSTGGMTNKRYGGAWGLAHHRRGHLRERALCSTEARGMGRVLHPLHRGPRHLRPCGVPEPAAEAGRRRRW